MFPKITQADDDHGHEKCLKCYSLGDHKLYHFLHINHGERTD